MRNNKTMTTQQNKKQIEKILKDFDAFIGVQHSKGCKIVDLMGFQCDCYEQYTKTRNFIRKSFEIYQKGDDK